MHLEANGLRLHVRDEGHGQPVPLLHGFPDSGPADPGSAGEAVVLRPFVRLIFRAYAADGTRQPWQLVERDTNEATSELFSFGYVAAAAGTRASGSGIAVP